MTKEITTYKRYLSEIMDRLPSNVLFDKGVTGCGGTYVEFNSPRNSIILVPTRELVNNKSEYGFVFYGGVSNTELKRYLESDVKYKKIIGTYDSLPRISKYINKDDYFLLIDEYHLLFNAYSYRNDAIVYILKNYQNFKNFCFMTATPLNDDIILEELKHLDRVSIKWKNAIPIKINIINTPYTSNELIKFIMTDIDTCNYHIFINSIKSIKGIINKTGITDYKVVCSEASKGKIKTLNIGDTKDPPQKINFYTATAFEGCDIYDPIGKTLILSDTNITTTILDISTLIRQIAGRLRDSIYKENITLILNTTRHRYAGVSKEIFELKVAENIRIGKFTEERFNNDEDPLYKVKELRSYTPDAYNSFYINRYENILYYDDNLRKVDEYNYILIEEIYSSSITVLKEVVDNDFEVLDEAPLNAWIWDKLQGYNTFEFSFAQLREIFQNDFNTMGIDFTGHTISTYFPEHTKKRKTVNKIKETYYNFNI